MNYTISDYEDEDLIVELKERGYAVYKNEEIQKSITQLEGLKSKLERINRMRGKQ